MRRILMAFLIGFVLVSIIPTGLGIASKDSSHQFSAVISSPGVFSNSQNSSARRNVSNPSLSLEETVNMTSLAEKVLGFLNRTQDINAQAIMSMDQAYYVGKSIASLSRIVGGLQSQGIVDVTKSVLEFVQNARNADGGYGNWKDAPSTMESTFQAISLFVALNSTDLLTTAEANQTLQFIQSLKTPSGGYFPIPDWDSPDMTSTFRALFLKKILKTTFPSLNPQEDPLAFDYVNGSFIPPFFIVGGSGYAEIPGGRPELLASYYAFKTYALLDTTSLHAQSVAKFLAALYSSNGGIAGSPGRLPTTGFTAIGIQLYLILQDNYTSQVDWLATFPSDFLTKAIQYMLGNREQGSGFTASERDQTAERVSTYLALQTIEELHKRGMIKEISDVQGIISFLVERNQPTLGFGDRPGDRADVEATAYAILTARLLNSTSWINSGVRDYLLDAHSPVGGFGFRPGSMALVKYTYYAVLALRALGYPLSDSDQILQFISASQNDNGGFGERPVSKLSYLTHTFWAMRVIDLLSFSPSRYANVTRLKNFLNAMRTYNGVFINGLGAKPSLLSTFRGLTLLNYLGVQLNASDPMNKSLEQFIHPSGGFKPRADVSYPTMFATFSGIVVSRLIQRPLNVSGITRFILSLQNPDGGFGERPKFSSSVRSTYYALLSLDLLQQLNHPNSSFSFSFVETTRDVFSPTIKSSFVPRLDTNVSFTGTYLTSARVLDPEGEVSATWAETIWYPLASGSEMVANFTGKTSSEDKTVYLYALGSFFERGILHFRIVAEDKAGNIARTEWFVLLTQRGASVGQSRQSMGQALLRLVLSSLLLVALSDDVKGIYSKRKRGNIRMAIPVSHHEKMQDKWQVILPMFYITLIMGIISFISRLFLKQALLILANSTFLFQFLLGAIVILTTRYVFGIRTYGFFAPMVLVISWTQIGPFWASAVFLSIFVVAYAVRILIDPFNLAHGFRLASLMIIAVSMLAMLEILGETLRIPVLTTTILLPIIITPSIVDHYVRDIQEKSHAEALFTLARTFLVVTLAYLIMSTPLIVNFVVFTPEVWTVMLLFIIYFGRSNKYTLTDWKRFRRLFEKKQDPLSLLIRNRDYIARYNATVLFPVINKYNMKDQFEKWRVPTPETLAVVSEESQIPELAKRLLSESLFADGFVIKPSQSFGGRGIVVISGKTPQGTFVIGGEEYHVNAVKEHIRKIINGEFLTSQTHTLYDIALVEQKITCYQPLQQISVGLPDVRIIVFRGIPVMAMARLPTQESDGKANLKQGAIGAAIDLRTGKITRAEYKAHPITHHPDTKQRIVDFELPSWPNILAIACLAQKSSGLGYAGVDIVIDEKGKPLVLEINKRPGLEIQNINLASLLKRLRFIEENNLDASNVSPLKAARLGMDLAETWKTQETKAQTKVRNSRNKGLKEDEEND